MNKRCLLAMVLLLQCSSVQALPLKPAASLPGGQARVTIRMRDTSLQDALKMLSERKKFNLILDESVFEAKDRKINLDFFDTPLNRVLDTILQTNGLSIQQIGPSYVVYRSGQPGQRLIRFLPLNYANSAKLTEQLSAIFPVDKAKGFGVEIRSDVPSNALIIMGPDAEVQTVELLAKQMDALLPRRVFHLNHILVTEAIDILKASFFPTAGGNGATVKTTYRDFAGTSAGTIPKTVTESVNTGEQVPRFVPLGGQNSLLVIGSNADLALAEQLLQVADHKPPQVLIRTQIVEVEQGALQNLGVNLTAGAQQLSAGFDAAANGQFRFETMGSQAANLKIALEALVTRNKARVLASPSVLAMHERTSVIRIVDDIVDTAQSQITTPPNSSPIVSRTINKGDVGITLELTPRIDRQNNIAMSVHPIISFVKKEERSSNQDIVATLKSTREFQTQEIRVKSGETLVIGGLIQDSQREQTEKVPLLGDLPVIGSLFRRVTQTSSKTEVQILITPEIVKDAET